MTVPLNLNEVICLSIWCRTKKFQSVNLSLWIQKHLETASGLLQPQLSPFHAAEGEHQNTHGPSLQEVLHNRTQSNPQVSCHSKVEHKTQGQQTSLASSSATWSRHGSHPKCLMRTNSSFWFWPRNSPRVTLLKNPQCLNLTFKHLWGWVEKVYSWAKVLKKDNSRLTLHSEHLWTQSRRRFCLPPSNLTGAHLCSADLHPRSAGTRPIRSADTQYIAISV